MNWPKISSFANSKFDLTLFFFNTKYISYSLNVSISNVIIVLQVLIPAIKDSIQGYQSNEIECIVINWEAKIYYQKI